MILTTVPEFCVHGISQKLITTEITMQIRWRMKTPPPSQIYDCIVSCKQVHIDPRQRTPKSDIFVRELKPS